VVFLRNLKKTGLIGDRPFKEVENMAIITKEI
jgi:hypothetical protein